MDPEDPDSDLNHSQNLITSSFYHFGHILKILSMSVHKFLNYLVHKQTEAQTNPGENITSLAEVKNTLTTVLCMVLQLFGMCSLMILFDDSFSVIFQVTIDVIPL